MRRARKQDRSAVVRILSQSFHDNRSVGYLVGGRKGRSLRLDRLMEFCFDCCMDFGRVYVSEDGSGCALVMFPDIKKMTFGGVFRDLGLVFSVIGIGALFKVLRREALIKKRYPEDEKIYYLWFVGCLPQFQRRGRGTRMMEFLLAEADGMNRRMYLETSVPGNVSWYKKLGLEVYDELDLSYTLYFLKN